jgi:hypothetical protein
MKSLETIEVKTWKDSISQEIQNRTVKALEAGKILYFPSLSFALNPHEYPFLSSQHVDPKTKNISYDLQQDRIKGTLYTNLEAQQLKEMMKRYALYSRELLEKLLPYYIPNIIQAKTSFRPIEIASRKISYRKDDSLLHVDSFPSNPVKGQRILRVFTNINPHGKPRIWRTGEPFEDVVKKMAPRVSRPIPGLAHLFKILKITKDLRTPYDHYMLQIHNRMKGDAYYQKTVPQEEIHFPTGSSWIVYTDQVSHAAMAGQHVLEQTFHLPLLGLKDLSTSPLKVLERFLNKKLL